MEKSELFNLNELAKEVHQLSSEMGWRYSKRTFDEVIATAHADLTRAYWEHSTSEPLVYAYRNGSKCSQPVIVITDINDFKAEDFVTGTAATLADCVSGLLDYCGKENIHLNLRNKGVSCGFDLIKLINLCHYIMPFECSENNTQNIALDFKILIECIIGWCEENNVDIYRILKIKYEHEKLYKTEK